MVIGFSSLALLGRPGDFVRPYLIARKEKISLSSQIGIWTIERIFDIGALAVLMAVDVLFSSQLRSNPYIRSFRFAAAGLCVFVVLLVTIAAMANKHANSLGRFVDRMTARFSGNWARLATQKMRDFAQGLKAVSTAKLFWQLAAVSIATWLIVAISYRQVAHAYVVNSPSGASDIPVSLDVETAKLAGSPALAGQELTPTLLGKLAPSLSQKGYMVQMKQNSFWVIQKGTSVAMPMGAHPNLARLGVSQMILLLGLGMLGSILQLPAIGGGTQLAVISGVEVLYGIPPELAISFAILLWLVTYISCVPLGLILAQREHLSMRGSMKRASSLS